MVAVATALAIVPSGEPPVISTRPSGNRAAAAPRRTLGSGAWPTGSATTTVSVFVAVPPASPAAFLIASVYLVVAVGTGSVGLAVAQQTLPVVWPPPVMTALTALVTPVEMVNVRTSVAGALTFSVVLSTMNVNAPSAPATVAVAVGVGLMSAGMLAPFFTQSAYVLFAPIEPGIAVPEPFEEMGASGAPVQSVSRMAQFPVTPQAPPLTKYESVGEVEPVPMAPAVILSEPVGTATTLTVVETPAAAAPAAFLDTSVYCVVGTDRPTAILFLFPT